MFLETNVNNHVVNDNSQRRYDNVPIKKEPNIDRFFTIHTGIPLVTEVGYPRRL